MHKGIDNLELGMNMEKPTIDGFESERPIKFRWLQTIELFKVVNVITLPLVE